MDYKEILIISFLVVWLIELYLFGMQRASLLISRTSNIDWKQIGSQILPKWYPITWIFRFAKWGLYVAIFYFLGWKWGICVFLASFILSFVIPIPYQLLYKGIFRKRVFQIKQIDSKAGIFFEEVLRNSGF